MHESHAPHPRGNMSCELDAFLRRHVGPDVQALERMLHSIGVDSLDALIAETVPAHIRTSDRLALPNALSEEGARQALYALAQSNLQKRSCIGQGYYDTVTPAVIQRNVLENPGWYTAYTPYQAEISQGRLEALLNFQQMVIDLTGMDVANASLLDEATAAAEAMAMAFRLSRLESRHFYVDDKCFAQTLDVLHTRARHFGIELIVGPAEQATQHTIFGALFQTPNGDGKFVDPTEKIACLHQRGVITAVATDPLALLLFKPPGEMGADIALGSTQRFGVPMAFGGPHAAFFAARRDHLRSLPGRIIGVSRDARGQPALRMALQTREQHIRREKATSNICTSQVLLANMAAFYAIYHGPDGLRAIATRVHRLTETLAHVLEQAGIRVLAGPRFDTVRLHSGARTEQWFEAAERAGFNLHRPDAAHLSISLDETTCLSDLADLLAVFGVHHDVETLALQLQTTPCDIPASLQRTTPYLSHPVFNSHHTEQQMTRYLRRLQGRDLALDQSMIPLGSCTLKLNAASEMMPVTWPQFARMHPFAPAHQTRGYRAMIEQLSDWLKRITGFSALSMQPNSGAQGEYAGLVCIARYHTARGQPQRDICLIPRSAHGTNPASAHLCGMQVQTVACDERGNIDLAELRRLCRENAARLAALMLTYPSTHGVFEAAVREICECVHEHGGQVYLDGANLNALIGISTPAALGADVAHVNLHKTFCIPHGGGGPGMGPIGVAAHLAPFMPDHTRVPTGPADRPNAGQGAVAAAPFGSPGILPIAWTYIAMMGADGLTHATRVAIASANYLAQKLNQAYPILFTGEKGRVAHECIIDIRPIREATGISETDIAKRLMDYGFHAPTISFPVPGTMMIEPTESEALDELDRFAEAMLQIRTEIARVEQGQWPADNNPLARAPHTPSDLTDELWDRPYSRVEAVFPLPWVKARKFWPSVNRIDEVYGDRNLYCGCVPEHAPPS